MRTGSLPFLLQNGQCEYGGSVDKQSDIASRIVADHARMICIAIADGLLPANQGMDGLWYDVLVTIINKLVLCYHSVLTEISLFPS